MRYPELKTHERRHIEGFYRTKYAALINGRNLEEEALYHRREYQRLSRLSASALSESKKITNASVSRKVGRGKDACRRIGLDVKKEYGL